MAEHPVAHGSAARPPGEGLFRRTFRALGRVVVRVYALAILLVVIWTGYTAVAYLVRTVFKPTPVPPEYLTWESALAGDNAEALRAAPSGLTLPRAPLAHYHDVDRTLPVDTLNGCLTSGCHHPLAHRKSKELRAFANLHATFLECGLCHNADIDGAAQAIWVDLPTGRPGEPPAVLQLMKLFESEGDAVQSRPADVHTRILGPLASAVEHSGDVILEHLRAQIATSEPGSPVWRHAVARLREELPNHVRGEYGVKLAPKMSEWELKSLNQGLVEMARPYLAAAEGSDERKRLHAEIHKGILARPSACLSCHGGEPARLDFAALGYPPERAAALRDSSIARLMAQIQSGQPFHLPRLLEGGNAP